MRSKDIRYKQRFENFEKSFLLLQQALEIPEPSIVEEAGSIQFFEITFELAWKVMKDYLEYEGYEIKSPRNAIKQAFSVGLVEDGERWLEALGDRNLTVHTYDETRAKIVYERIKRDYFPLLQAFYRKCKEEICTD